ncbi:MAG: hypothetical protein IPH57_18995 [Saprospiraceae bacterium]|nr:hypothetical protein [Saprospiraceae bacterium]
MNVSSIFSDTYTNIPVDYYNGYWQPYQTTLSADFEVNGDRICTTRISILQEFNLVLLL